MNPSDEVSLRAQFSALLQLQMNGSPQMKDYLAHAMHRGWTTFRHLPSGGGEARLLDVGSAGGIFGPAYIELWQYREVHLLGYDVPADGRIERTGSGGRRHVFPTAHANIELDRWPYEDATFDTVICTEVLEHLIFDPVFAMNELCRVLKPGGLALITVPNATSDACLSMLVNNSQPGFLRHYISDALKSGERNLGTVYNLGHFHEYTGPELEALARATGLRIERLTGINTAPDLVRDFKFQLLRRMVRALFPRSRRIRETNLLLLARKEAHVPLDKLARRYPVPLYRPLGAEH